LRTPFEHLLAALLLFTSAPAVAQDSAPLNESNESNESSESNEADGTDEADETAGTAGTAEADEARTREAEEVMPAEAPPVAPAPAPASPAAVARPDRPLRIAVYELELHDIPPEWGVVVMQSLLTELRKLERVNVVGMDEIRAMLGHEAEKQAAGCDQESCLSEIADALGVDDLVIGTVSRIGDEHVVGFKRLNQLEAKTTGSYNQRFEAGNGEELLVAVGPGVEELFPDRPLRAGEERGVPAEVAARLNPPPLPRTPSPSPHSTRRWASSSSRAGPPSAFSPAPSSSAPSPPWAPPSPTSRDTPN
jgi:hypothetical protein